MEKASKFDKLDPSDVDIPELIPIEQYDVNQVSASCMVEAGGI